MVGFMNKALNLFGLGGKKEGEVVDLDLFLGELANKLGYQINFKRADSAEPGTFYEIEGEEAESFVGRSTEILDALSHLCNRIVRRQLGPVAEGAQEGEKNEEELLKNRVVFDTAGFRTKRVEELKELARNQRERVVSSGGKPSYIPALSPSERKVIHTHLAELGDVMSESIGRGNFKRIRIRLPDDSPLRKEQPRSAEGPGNGPRGPRRNGGGGGQFGRGGGNRNGRGNNGGGGGRGRFNKNNNNYGNNNVDDNVGNYGAPVFNDNLDEGAPMVDDNIGNRLKPGEETPYKLND